MLWGTYIWRLIKAIMKLAIENGHVDSGHWLALHRAVEHFVADVGYDRVGLDGVDHAAAAF